MNDNANKIAQNLSVPDEITQLAITALGNETQAEAWLITPIPALNDETPTAVIHAEEGGVEVIRALLCKIRIGEFS